MHAPLQAPVASMVGQDTCPVLIKSRNQKPLLADRKVNRANVCV
jgi:hypothetical protein